MNDWTPIVLGVIAGVASFLPIWWKNRRGSPMVMAVSASKLTEGAGELVDRYEKLLKRMEETLEEQDRRISELEAQNVALINRVADLEQQLKNLGHEPV